jgi:PEGA domain-containing protein
LSTEKERSLRDALKHRSSLLLLVLLLGLPRLAAAGESGDAEALIREGVELRAKGKDERALPLFEKAYQTSRTPRTAGQLGLVELAVGYFVEAERYLSEAIASPDHPWVAKNLPMLKKQLEAAKTKIGELAVTGTPAGAEVWVNGKVAGTLPLPAPIRLDKGRVEVQVRATGYFTATDAVNITGGKREDRSYALVRQPAAAPPPVATAPAPVAAAPKPTAPPPVATAPAPVAAAPKPTAPPPVVAMPAPTASTPPAAPSASAPPTGTDTPLVTATAAPTAGEPGPLRPWAYVAAGGAVAGLALGTIEALSAASKRDEFNKHTGYVNGVLGYDCGTDAISPACKPIKNAHDQAVTLSIVGFVAGGALAAGATVLYLMSAPESGHTSAGLGCVPNPATRGLTCSLRF